MEHEGEYISQMKCICGKTYKTVGYPFKPLYSRGIYWNIVGCIECVTKKNLCGCMVCLECGTDIKEDEEMNFFFDSNGNNVGCENCINESDYTTYEEEDAFLIEDYYEDALGGIYDGRKA